jgi:hypothetical protein
MTKSKQAIIDDAKAAGFHVTTDGREVTYIFKRNRFRNVSAGVAIYPDGTAFDLMADLSAAKAIRSHATMRQILGIGR